MLFKFFVYLRVGPVVFMVLEYGLLVGGIAFIALTIITSLFIPMDDELLYAKSSAWRRESQTLTGQQTAHGTPTIRVPVPVAAAKEMNTYYSSLLDVDGDGAAGRLNSDLCNRLEVVHETRDSCTESEYDDDDDEHLRIVV